MNQLIREVQQAYAQRHTLPTIKAGDIINIHAKIVEKDKERIQQFQGTVIQVRGHKHHIRNITVRKLTNGIGVERIFPIPSPNIVNIEVKRQSKVARKRLFYLRNIKGEIKTKVKYKIA